MAASGSRRGSKERSGNRKERISRSPWSGDSSAESEGRERLFLQLRFLIESITSNLPRAVEQSLRDPLRHFAVSIVGTEWELLISDPFAALLNPFVSNRLQTPGQENETSNRSGGRKLFPLDSIQNTISAITDQKWSEIGMKEGSE
jgi:hypothetical protein